MKIKVRSGTSENTRHECGIKCDECNTSICLVAAKRRILKGEVRLCDNDAMSYRYRREYDQHMTMHVLERESEEN